MSESQRLQALRELDMLDTPAEARFDRLTRLACRLLRCPFAMVSLVDEHRQWFKAAQGHLYTQSPRGESFCNETIQRDGPLVVPDASVDQRFFDLPSVQQGIRFYAGFPIRTQDGSAVGTLCVLDAKPRQLESADLAALEDLAACVESEIQRAASTQSERELLAEMDQVRRQLTTDEVTRCWNQASILELIEKERANSKPTTLSLCLVVVNNLPSLNQRYGAEAGDILLRQVAERLRTALGPGELLGRLRGPRFLVLTRAPLAQQQAYGDRLLREVTATPISVNEQLVAPVITIAIVPAREAGEAALARAEKSARGLDPSQSGVILGL